MRRLFIMRPEPGASATVCEAAKLGLDAVAMPLFSVKPLNWDVPDTTEFDGLLLTSANAVRHGGEGMSRLRALPVHAVGEATAKIARETGFDIATTGNDGVERLLGQIDPGLRLLHLCGEHWTPVQADQPITHIPAYQASVLPTPAGLAAIQGQTVALHSARAARRLSELVNQERIARSTIRVAAISRAVASAAGDDWEACEAAERPDSPTLLALAARLCDKPGQL
jgi:uroporphyrinogen-III synthase